MAESAVRNPPSGECSRRERRVRWPRGETLADVTGLVEVCLLGDLAEAFPPVLTSVSVPLLLLTRRRDVMGEMVNQRRTTVVGVLVTAVILALIR